MDDHPSAPSSPRRLPTEPRLLISPRNRSASATPAPRSPRNRDQRVMPSPPTLARPVITAAAPASPPDASITRRRQRRSSAEVAAAGSSSSAASSADASPNRRYRLSSEGQTSDLRHGDRQHEASADRRPNAMLVQQDADRRHPSSSSLRGAATTPSSSPSRSSSVARAQRLGTKRRVSEGQVLKSSTVGAVEADGSTTAETHLQRTLPLAHSHAPPNLTPMVSTTGNRSISMSSLPPPHIHIPQGLSGAENNNLNVDGAAWKQPYRTNTGVSVEFRRDGKSRMVSSRSENSGLEALGLEVPEGIDGLASTFYPPRSKVTAAITSPGHLVPIPPARSRLPSLAPSSTKGNAPSNYRRGSAPSSHASPEERWQYRQSSMVPPSLPPFMRSASSFSNASGDDTNKPSPPIPNKNPLRSRMNSRSSSTMRDGTIDLNSVPLTGPLHNVSPQHTSSIYSQASTSNSAAFNSDGSGTSFTATLTPDMEDLTITADKARNQLPVSARVTTKENISSALAPDKSISSPPTGQSPVQPSPSPPSESLSRSMWNVPSALKTSASADFLSNLQSRSPSSPSSLTVDAAVGSSVFPPFNNRNAVPRLHVFTNHKLSETAANTMPSVLASRPRRSIQHLRAQSIPTGPLVSPNFSSSSIDSMTLRSPTKRMTKRAHLIQEIIETERSFARDLALIRDAYLYRLRPNSAHSSTSHGGVSDGQSPMAFGGPGSRVSIYTFETADTRRSSVSESPGVISYTPNSDSGVSFTPGKLGARTSGYFGDLHSMPPPSAFLPHRTNSSGAGSFSNFTTPQPSPRTSSLPTATAIPAQTDLKTIFVNLEQLAAFSEELCNTFLAARGDGSGEEVVEEPLPKGITSTHRSDRLGLAFLSAMPSISSLYTVYCARQAQANIRLQELLSDTKLANYFSECWTSVQPFTNAWDLASVLIKPVQRVMKYPMLFADLLACTSPVHPDYFDLRKAAEGARKIADEINETKRRKDVIERVVFPGVKRRDSGVASQSTEKNKSASGGVALKLGKRFRKDKNKVDTSGHLTPSLKISLKAEEELREQIRRFEAGDKVVRRVGKEINGWPERVRILWVSQRSMLDVWTRVVQLESSDPMDGRIDGFKALIEDVLGGPLMVMEDDVSKSVMPLFSRLLRMAVNPRVVISRLDSKRSDYIRVSSATSKSDHKSLDRAAMQNAEEFMAIHTQLREELPRFIEGYTKILDLALGAFADAQAGFYAGTKDRLRKFMEHWRLTDGMANQIDDGRSVVKRWHDIWKSSMDALDALEIVHPSTSTVSSRDLSLTDLASVSRNTSTRVNLSRNSSMSRFRDLTTSRPSSPTGQRAPSPSTGSAGVRGNRVRSSSLMNQVLAASHISVGSSRTSIVMDEPKEELVGTPASDFGPSLLNKESAKSLTAAAAARRRDSDGTSLLSYIAISPDGTPLLSSDVLRTPLKLGSPFPGGLRSPSMGDTRQAISSWQKEPALYTCVCVASFSLDLELWYAGLPFLNPMEEGEVVDILHEVGRVDMLEDLPIDVGVPDDGLLVGRNQHGQVGVLLCSYAIPLV